MPDGVCSLNRPRMDREKTMLEFRLISYRLRTTVRDKKYLFQPGYTQKGEEKKNSDTVPIVKEKTENV